ncbi:hypothetical protein CMI38_05110 [Candidatus Pacearchaeota archaeon]|jgi:putative transposase|nr:hypothetical protein [Candidatus Pacearchaeota archaeon]|tara:strand:- start:321 stop:782 length:462 start_codon:yes stop_codon:yes gene_type:complete
MKQQTLSESYKEIKYEKINHMVGMSMWHFEWCSKYRYKAFRKWKYKKLAEGCLRKAATEYGIKWFELDVQPNHVHGSASIPMTMTPSKALGLLKGRASKLFFERCPNMRLRYKKGHLWSRGKFAASLGFVNLDVVNNYIKNQDKHHKTKWITE